MVTGGYVGFGTADFVQVGQQFRGECCHIQSFPADVNAVAGNDVGGCTGITEFVLVVVGFDVVDQAFVQWPGVQLAFPVIHDGIAEAENL